MNPQAVPGLSSAFPELQDFQALMGLVGAAVCWRKAPCEDEDIVTGECFAFPTHLWPLLFCPELGFVSLQQPGTVESVEEEAGSLARGKAVPPPHASSPGPRRADERL
ncbi:hypothetical protein DUI87_24569 [Hirundo rustica rustica]|uniref:Uncharacterized protein n=1 Tax=Hirundo rustica rustica TaxID=333673 RepID=A0A3M0JJ09_HIRRU|nr:hypothetical protein DUI87_24569 [Hirundo rustica rustica]